MNLRSKKKKSQRAKIQTKQKKVVVVILSGICYIARVSIVFHKTQKSDRLNADKESQLVFTFFLSSMQSFVQFKNQYTALLVFLFALHTGLCRLFLSLSLCALDDAIKIKAIWQFAHSWKMIIFSAFEMWILMWKHNEIALQSIWYLDVAKIIMKVPSFFSFSSSGLNYIRWQYYFCVYFSFVAHKLRSFVALKLSVLGWYTVRCSAV